MSATREDVLRLTEELIRIESHIDAAGRETAVGRFLADWFGDRGIETELQAVGGGAPNLIARIRGGDGPSLMLNGHLDTVAAGGMEDAFEPRVEDGVLWGRGACDMKGAIAAMAIALAQIHTEQARERSSASLGGDLFFAGTVDEESGSLGAKALIDGGIRADYAVVGEPSNLRVTVAHKGSCFVRVSLAGRGAHGSCPDQGVNAASYAARIITAIEDELRPRLAERSYPLLGPSTVSIGRVCGGTQPNIVAERCEIEIDRRYLPGEAYPVPEVRDLIASICDGVEGLSYEVDEMPMSAVVRHGPLGTSAESKLALAAREACREAGLPPDPIGVTYWSDGGHFAANGIETVVLGPGDIANAHGPVDRVPIEELHSAVDIYLSIVRRILGGRL
jgi:acetylornithine deacetylase/succinyl-diaminopimelate desuccinylase